MSRRTLVISAALTVIVLGAVALAIAAQRKAPAPSHVYTDEPLAPVASGELPVMWQVPKFSFVAQNGRRTTASDLEGHVFIADFVFTSCTTICPLITAKMALLQRRLERHSNVRFVSFSVDPERDTPEALKRYATAWRPGETRWLLLSTTPNELKSLASGMFVNVRPVDDDIAHSNLFFLVDARGGVRGIYESDKNDALDRLVGDTEGLLRATPEPAKVAPGPHRSGNGRDLYAALGCGACHARNELAPSLEGLAGRRVKLEGGAEVSADAAYVRESIVAPDAKLALGHVLRMPSYEKELTASDLDALVAYVMALGTSETPAPEAQKPAEIAFDPVCSMKVRVTSTTPRAEHAGKTTYFCSESCRERFVADPVRYSK
jgi:protein SCO1/2